MSPSFTEQDLLDCIELALKRSFPDRGTDTFSPRQKSHIAMGLRSALPITSPTCRVSWRKDPRMLVYRNLEGQDIRPAEGPSSSNEQVTQYIREASASIATLAAPETAEFLAREIGKTLLGFMMKSDSEPDLAAPLASVGIDSLISVELRSWVRRWVGIEMTTLEIMRCPNLQALGTVAQGKLVEKYGSRAS